MTKKPKHPSESKRWNCSQPGTIPSWEDWAREMLDFPPARAAAVAALRKNPGPETAEALVSRIAEFPLKARNEAINLLATRADMALILLKAVDEKKLQSSLISPVMLDQLSRFENKELDAIIQKNWVMGTGAVDPAAIEAWKKKLNPQVLAKANASRGRQVYNMTCGTCHQLFGQGIALGPDLTGSNRADLAYLLDNVIAPSAVVGKDYQLNIFTMKDGSVVSGMVRETTPEFIKVAMPGGATADVKLADVAKREELAQSLMTPGLFDALPLAQVADLVKYLQSPNQVPLPGEGPKNDPNSAVPPPAKGSHSHRR